MPLPAPKFPYHITVPSVPVYSVACRPYVQSHFNLYARSTTLRIWHHANNALQLWYPHPYCHNCDLGEAAIRPRQFHRLNFADHLRIQPIVIGVPWRPAGILQIEPNLE